MQSAQTVPKFNFILNSKMFRNKKKQNTPVFGNEQKYTSSTTWNYNGGENQGRGADYGLYLFQSGWREINKMKVMGIGGVC